MGLGLSPLAVHLPLTALNAPDGLAFNKMLKGIQRYASYAGRAPFLPLEEVWRAGEVSLKVLPEQGPDDDVLSDHAPCVVLIPSLVNRARVFHITPQYSVMQNLRALGIRSVLLDWGEPLHDPQQKTLEGLISSRLTPALRAAGELFGQQVFALGYCMGGTLLALSAAAARPYVRGGIFLATPWDFSCGREHTLFRLMSFWLPTGLHQIQASGNLNHQWLQSIFAAVDPALTVQKFAGFYDLEEGTEAFDRFLAVEDWLNDGVDLPADIAHSFLCDGFRDNLFAQKGCGWDVPALVVASQQDRLVPYESALGLSHTLSHAKTHTPACGHIGMIAGKSSFSMVWQGVADWVHENS